MANVDENPSVAVVEENNKKNGDSELVSNDEQGNDKIDAELEIQNNEHDLEALVEEEEEKDRTRRRSWDRTRGREKKNSRERDRDRVRRRELNRRDPNKSNKDIEQDKARAKKDSDTKALAAKEKAIKTLLDSNELVPPGTEEEAIKVIEDKNKQKKETNGGIERSRNRKRSPIHKRLGPICKSPLRKKTKSPIRYSPPKRRSPSAERRKRSPNWECFLRKRSKDRDASLERRESSRRRLRERRERDRSRSRERHRSRSLDRGRRSRSFDRRRSRSFDRRRRSRSFNRRSPPRRRQSISRSRSPTRPRKRSPFINELARQFSVDTLRPADGTLGGPIGGPTFIPTQGIPGMMSMATPSGMIPGPIPGPMDMIPGVVPSMHPGGPPMMHPPYGGFESMGFDPLGRGPIGPPAEYGSGPVLYNQPGLPPLGAPIQQRISPQPVPAPFTGVGPVHSIGPGFVPIPNYSPNSRQSPKRNERIRTPEPPIISDFKQNEKFSLSSLLEASVSSTTASKDVHSSNSTFKGHKPEVIRQCEKALRSLPTEDPRLNMKGRFFFDPNKKLLSKDLKNTPASNSVLLRKGRTEIHWEEEFNQMNQTTSSKSNERKRVITLQKICQTEQIVLETIAVQTEELKKIDFGMQVEPNDLMPVDINRSTNSTGVVGDCDDRRGSFENRRNFEDSSVDRQDRFNEWNMRQSFDHANNSNNNPMTRNDDDLRWSLSNNRGNSWNSNLRNFSPPRHDVPSLDMMRSGLMDNNNRIMNRGTMDFREVDIREREIREREIRERELLIDHQIRMDLTGHCAGQMKDFMRRDQIENLDLRNRFEDQGLFNRQGVGGGGGGSLNNRSMERDQMVIPNRDKSTDEINHDDDLEIIEERPFNREAWQRLNSGAQYNNARGGAGPIAAGLRTTNLAASKRQLPTSRGNDRMNAFRQNF